jgi:hypothetical protein
VARLYFRIKRQREGGEENDCCLIKGTNAATSLFSEEFHQFSVCRLIILLGIKKTQKWFKSFHPPTVSKSS